MTWFWVVVLGLICVAVGGYVYLVEYRGSGGAGPLSLAHGEIPEATEEPVRRSVP
jgi:hypothetical protein